MQAQHQKGGEDQQADREGDRDVAGDRINHGLARQIDEDVRQILHQPLRPEETRRQPLQHIPGVEPVRGERNDGAGDNDDARRDPVGLGQVGQDRAVDQQVDQQRRQAAHHRDVPVGRAMVFHIGVEDPGFEHARDQDEQHHARAEGDQIADHRLDHHAAQNAGRGRAAGQGEDGEHEEGGGDRNAEAGQDQENQRRQHMPPMNAGFGIGNAVQATKGDIAVIAEISVEHDGDDDAGCERPQDQPVPFGVGRQERPEGLDHVVRHNGVRSEHEAYQPEERDAENAQLPKIRHEIIS